ncbi:hypothetical protein J0S82_012698 [Galemys pyrenaicus]|uniref:Uncharacterized protein n=1 Tax=Galemys pyrenaicus TaxID=202257 RepID=A0A8J6ALD3_GALPY|nr:hypothetical protein J0S82_012698 [Galemys pyrenaicus]
MEVLDEFDNECPQSVTFCQLISEEDFERQAATYTERALRRLFRSIDRNPALAERAVRLGKQAECERRGLLSFLWVRAGGRGCGGATWRVWGRQAVLGPAETWTAQLWGSGASGHLTHWASSALPLPPLQAKFFCAVQGELNYCNSMDTLEMHQRLEQLKRRIHRAHLYSQAAKKKRRKSKLKKLEPILLRDQSTSPCLPRAQLPPPPPATTVTSVVAASSPSYTMPKVFGPFSPLSSKSKLTSPSLPSCSHMVDLTPLVLNPGGFHFPYLTGNSARKLHGPGFPWSSACRGSPNIEEVPSPSVKASIFTPPVLLKFQPVPRPKDDSENDPGSAESVPPKRSP